MAWRSYELDRRAQKLVLDAKQRDPDSLNQAYKMRMTTAYGLERFWGEHLRLQGHHGTQAKATFWRETWTALVEIMRQAGITVPNDQVQPNNTTSIRNMAQRLWSLSLDDQRVTLAVLTQLCDAIVWWTQRYK
ncbi:MAG: hypothetical protein RMK91_01040 [Pseudanabaenaceae cyanobacterium SKYGB_i_bin29]|nr:hypothetical protein [Pseudanabaenaceae cyanobacterium SKYG29]MDW8420436.1 hypothetical protein [Pseudanabaenaceae cyanobacterium SKYGB_i_bin29]